MGFQLASKSWHEDFPGRTWTNHSAAPTPAPPPMVEPPPGSSNQQEPRAAAPGAVRASVLLKDTSACKPTTASTRGPNHVHQSSKSPRSGGLAHFPRAGLRPSLRRCLLATPPGISMEEGGGGRGDKRVQMEAEMKNKGERRRGGVRGGSVGPSVKHIDPY